MPVLGLYYLCEVLMTDFSKVETTLFYWYESNMVIKSIIPPISKHSKFE